MVITPKIDPQRTERKGSGEHNHAAPCSSGTGWKIRGVFRDAILRGKKWSHKLQEEHRGYSLGDEVADRRELEREQL